MNLLARPAPARPRRTFPGLPLAAAVLCCLAFLLAPPGAGAATEEPPRFYIETVAVEGALRPSSADIIRTETRLATGREHTEGELRDAVYRVHRLPFVLDAELSLRRGSERGKFVLVIAVQETNSGFFAAEVELLKVDEPLGAALGHSAHGEVTTRAAGTVGFRLFLGPRGLLFGALHNDELQAGYTRYGLFGRNGTASFAVSVSPSHCCSPGEILPLGLDPAFSSWSTGSRRRTNLAVHLPLAGNHGLRASATELTTLTSSRRTILPADLREFFDDEDFSRRDVELKWIYDTRDDPLFPGRGTALSAGVELAEASFPLRLPLPSGEPFPAPPADARSESRMMALAAAATRSWSPTPRQALTLGGRAALGRSEVDRLVRGGAIEGPQSFHTREAAAEVKHSLALWSAERTRAHGDLRLETFAAYGYEAISPDSGILGNPVRRVSAGISVVFRHAWGVYRLGFTGLELEGEPR